MAIKKLHALVICLLIIFSSATASHVVGGYFTYEFVDLVQPNQVRYRVEFRLYRDCRNGNPNAPLETVIPLTIFDANNFFLVGLDSLPNDTISLVPDTLNNPCVVDFEEVCVEEGIYRNIISLDRDRDFKLVFQRCCRNRIIDNIVNPEDQGNTFSIDIPAFNRVGTNSSPSFNRKVPPILMCSQFDVRLDLDLSATDADDDSLVYSLCAPLNYVSSVIDPNPTPFPAFPPPYSTVPFRAPQSAGNPVPSDPAIMIDQSTGIITGVPTSLGNFVIGICVDEYRNGELLSRVLRDIQINTADCDPLIISAVQEQEQFCDGLTVQFRNQTNSPDPNVNENNFEYKWDFGEPGVLGDTSREREPVYTYSSPGIYDITLTVNPDLPCRDDTTVQFEVLDKLDPTINIRGDSCTDSNNLDFFVGGAFEDHATFEWNFGGNASVQTSDQDSVFGVEFSGDGPFPIQLTAFQDNCTVTLDEQLNLVDNPIIDFSISDSDGCLPLIVNFTDVSSFSGSAQFFWDFGDNNSISSEQNPTHTYTETGVYSIGLLLITEEGCLDTVQKSLDSIIIVRELPTSRFTLSDTSISLKQATVDIDGGTSLMADSSLIFINGELIANSSSLNYRFLDTGHHQVDLVVFNQFECSDTSQKEVFVFDEFEFIIPNVFTPNQDGLNDEFKVQACGVYGYEILIFNRFGEKVFESNSLNISWDGRHRGRPLNQGIYFYTIQVLDFRNEYLDFQGTVTLLRD